MEQTFKIPSSDIGMANAQFDMIEPNSDAVKLHCVLCGGTSKSQKHAIRRPTEQSVKWKRKKLFCDRQIDNCSMFGVCK